MIPGPAHLYLFILYYEAWDFSLHIFDYNIKLEDLNMRDLCNSQYIDLPTQTCL
jgi:hypothetical protein